MAKIVDPDSLSIIVNGSPTTEEVSVDTDAKTIQLRIAGNLDDDSPGSTSGVTKQCLYSFLKEEWKTDTTLNKFKFPLKAIYEAKFIWQYGWQPADAQTRDLIRDAGWQEIDGAEYACVISLGSQYDTTQQGNYQQVEGFDQATTNFDKTGALDEAILIYDGSSNDYRDYLKLYLREWYRTYSDYNVLTEQGFTALTYIAYRAPLANANDIKNTGTTQAYVDGANEPYMHMDLQYYSGQEFDDARILKAYVLNDVVRDGDSPQRWARCTGAGDIATPGNPYATFGGTSTWEAYPGERQIGTSYYAFNRTVQYSGAETAPDRDEIYKFCQNELTKASDINSDPDGDLYGVVNGEVAVRLCYYVGDTLHSWPGVNFDDFDSNITNTIVLHDITAGSGVNFGLDAEDVPNTSTERQYPFTAAGNMVFSTNLVDETNADTLYRMYFKNIAEQTATNFAITNATGSYGELTGTGMTISASGEYFTVAGFANSDNNGVKKAIGTPSATNVEYVDALGATQQDEGTGPSVTLEEQPFDTDSAIIVDNNSDVDIEGQVTTASIAFDFDYDGNTQGGRTAASDASVVVVAQGLNDSEWIFAEFTITRTTGLNFPVNAPDERTYLNP
jgi:hypothetical protein